MFTAHLVANFSYGRKFWVHHSSLGGKLLDKGGNTGAMDGRHVSCERETLLSAVLSTSGAQSVSGVIFHVCLDRCTHTRLT